MTRLLVFLVAALLLSTSALQAGDRPFPFHGKISVVDKAAKTFTLEGKTTSRVFAVTEETKLSKESGDATFDDLSVGNVVRGLARKNPDGAYTAVSVKIGPNET